MPYGYQYGQSGGLKSVTPGSPYQRMFPQLGNLLFQIMQDRRHQEAIALAEKKRGQEIADAAWRDAAKFNANPARSEYQNYFQTQNNELMDIGTKVRRQQVPVDDVYTKMKAIDSDLTKVDRFDKEATQHYTKWKDSGYRNMGEVDKIVSGHVYDTQLSGQMGGKVVKHPKDLSIDGMKSDVDNSLGTYSPSKLTESFVKRYIEPLLETKQSLSSAPFNKIRMDDKQVLPSSLTDGTHLSSGKLRILVGDPGSPNSNKLLSQWEAMSPDHAKFLDLKVATDNPGVDLASLSQKEYGILKQKALQDNFDINGHVERGKTASHILSPPENSSASAANLEEKRKKFDLKAKVLYDLHTGDDKAVAEAVANLNNGSDQTAQYNKEANTITVAIQKPDKPNPFNPSGPLVPGDVQKVIIDLSKPVEAVPIINSLWQRASPVKSEEDTQLLLDRLKTMGIEGNSRAKGGNKFPGQVKLDGGSPDEMISVTSPDGKTGKIPKAKLDAALKAGFKLNK